MVKLVHTTPNERGYWIKPAIFCETVGYNEAWCPMLLTEFCFLCFTLVNRRAAVFGIWKVKLKITSKQFSYHIQVDWPTSTATSMPPARPLTDFLNEARAEIANIFSNIALMEAIETPSSFSHTFAYIFFAYVVKSSDTGHSRSGHQVTSKDLNS